jgi:hypothetical protein
MRHFSDLFSEPNSAGRRDRIEACRGLIATFFMGAFTRVPTGEYQWECLRYVELTMVRCGVVKHPADWRGRAADKPNTPPTVLAERWGQKSGSGTSFCQAFSCVLRMPLLPNE